MIETTGHQPLLFTPNGSVLEQFVMLGTTVPEPVTKDPTKDNRVVVCSAGVSEKGLTRIHPLDWRNVPKRWQEYRVPVERNPRDNREETYRVAGDNESNKAFEYKGRLPPSKRKPILDPYRISSIRQANDDRISLGVLQPLKYELFLEASNAAMHQPMAWFYKYGLPVKARQRYPFIPRLRYTDADGEHNHMLRDWGVFERMRKFSYENSGHSEQDLLEHIRSALRISDVSCFFVGNYLHFRNAWCVISILNKIGD